MRWSRKVPEARADEFSRWRIKGQTRGQCLKRQEKWIQSISQGAVYCQLQSSTSHCPLPGSEYDTASLLFSRGWARQRWNVRAVPSQTLSTVLWLADAVASKHIFCTICFAFLLFVTRSSVCAPTQQYFDVPTMNTQQRMLLFISLSLSHFSFWLDDWNDYFFLLAWMSNHTLSVTTVCTAQCKKCINLQQHYALSPSCIRKYHVHCLIPWLAAVIVKGIHSKGWQPTVTFVF